MSDWLLELAGVTPDTDPVEGMRAVELAICRLWRAGIRPTLAELLALEPLARDKWLDTVAALEEDARCRFAVLLMNPVDAALDSLRRVHGVESAAGVATEIAAAREAARREREHGQ